MGTELNKQRVKAWAQFILIAACIWIFAGVIGPWGEKNIPVFNTIVKTIDARGIDSGAYFYSDIPESYSAQREISGAIHFSESDQTRFTLAAWLGIAVCLLILIFGFRRLP